MKFRNWAQQIWFEHIDEMVAYTGKVPSYTAQQYFHKYRWWLAREFRARGFNNKDTK